jgi:hypothetical protein
MIHILGHMLELWLLMILWLMLKCVSVSSVCANINYFAFSLHLWSYQSFYININRLF